MRRSPRNTDSGASALKDQYVGDINDYRKYALLRALSADGANRLGVCWMLTESDGGNHGSWLGYMEQTTFTACCRRR